jgi:putative toxin-antitoxin system antitoxin component (TIGR02293 family)
MQTERVVKMLGGEELLGAKIHSASDLIPVVRKGLRYRSLDKVIAGLGIARETVMNAIGLPVSEQKRGQSASRMSAAESDRVYRLARVAAQAEMILASEEKAHEWLMRPNRALGQVTPLSLLDTDEGARQVEAVLGRIEHGVWS